MSKVPLTLLILAACSTPTASRRTCTPTTWEPAVDSLGDTIAWWGVCGFVSGSMAKAT
jgi:hypothetical protein